MTYEQFKRETNRAEDFAQKAFDMQLISEDMLAGFSKAMWEAREIFMRLDETIYEEGNND